MANKLSIIVYILGLVLISSANAEPAKQEMSFELAKTMMLGQAALLGMEASMREGGSNKEQLSCVASADPNIINKVYSKILEENLTSSQLKSSLEFYSNKSGKKYTLSGFYMLKKQLGLYDNSQNPNFTKEDENEIGKFFLSEAGTILIKSRLLQSAKVEEAINPKLKSLYDKCKLQ